MGDGHISVTNLVGCARCHGNHDEMHFEMLTYPVELAKEPDLTHWASCPTTGEPVLMCFTQIM